MAGAPGNPPDPTERDRSVSVDQSGEPGSRGIDPTRTTDGPPSDPATDEPTASLNQDKTGAWQPKPVSNAANRTGDGDALTDLMGDDQPNPTVGTRIQYIGDYELLNVVGKGGMGVVYRARQVSLNRVVALKLIRLEGSPTEAEARRFQHEAEAVASLDHPAIVPIYEVGINDGRHYFSMKLIAGESLRQAIPRLRGNYPDIGKILAEAARAVQHAHERGILHRDLKPANILLDPTDAPHVTDFGLAKRIETGDSEATQTDAILGTPAYMAPEQATASRGAITTATDVYGLGAVLYALLSGHAPHRGSSALETLDAVRETMPEAPSKADPTIPRDLDVICMKCLDKDPRRRYRSAGDLADDIDRWLEGRPITARHVGVGSRAVMWCRRRPLIAGLAAALVLAVSIGSTGILINWLGLRRANAQIRAEWEASRVLNMFLVIDLIGQSSPFTGSRRDMPVSTLLDRSAKLAASRFAGRPKIEGSIRQALGNAYLALGMLPKAEIELLDSSRLRQSLPEGDELDRLSVEYLLAKLRCDQGRYDEAETHAINAHEGRLRRLGESDEATLEAAEALGAILKLKGKLDDARKILERTAASARQALGDEHRVTLRTWTDLAVIAYDEGQFREALASFDQIATISARVYGGNDPETLFVRSNLGATLANLGEDARAEKILAEALGQARDVLGADYPETLRINGNLAFVRSRVQKFDEATRGIEESLKGQQNLGAAGNPSTLATELNRVLILLDQAKLAEGEQLLRDLIPRMRAHLSADDFLLGSALTSRAAALWDLNRTAEAETLNAEAIGIFRKRMPADHPEVVNAEATQAALLLANGKPTEAERLAARVVEVRSRPGWVGSPARLGSIKSVLGGALAAQKKFTAAEPLLLEGYRTIEAEPMANKRRRDDALERLIRLNESLGKEDEAAKWRTRRTPASGQ